MIAEREWVATWIELIDASLYTPPGTPRAGRILREAYAEGSIRLPVIRDLGRSLLPHPSVDTPGRSFTTRSVAGPSVQQVALVEVSPAHAAADAANAMMAKLWVRRT